MPALMNHQFQSDPRLRIGIDIGGTFTDFTVVDDLTGEVIVNKCLTTPDRPEDAVLAGLEVLSASKKGLLDQAGAVVHATTLATNVVIERKGAPTGLLTTDGFRDILEIGRESRYHLYDLFIRFPEPLVPLPLRYGITERIYSDGSVLQPLAQDDVIAASKAFRDAGVKSVAICFLHAYRNAEHEIRARELLMEAMPDVAISVSHEVHPEPKEYERSSTTVVDAYVKPVMDAYLGRLETDLNKRGYRQPLLMMQSSGGVISADAARHHPVQVIESGPAAGVEAAAFFGRLLEEADVLSFDMGGTTAKLCLLQDGHAVRTRSFEVDRMSRFRQGSGIPVAIPVYDLLEIGAGGGSIARLNDLDLLQVGPNSAGSAPGPACYGRGGTEPTVTDANLVLGHLNPDYFLGGEMMLEAEAARDVLTSRIAEPSGLPVMKAAYGVVDLVNETMASAARIYVAEKGKDAKKLTIIAFGGAGPLHAAALARKLGCRRVVIPPLPGVMSSFGLLATPLAFEQTCSIRQLLDELDGAALDIERKALQVRATESLPNGVPVTFRCIAEICHLSQDYPLEIEVTGAWSDPAVREKVKDDFRNAYENLYGRTDDENPIELVSLRVQAVTKRNHINLQSREGLISKTHTDRTRLIYHALLGEAVETPIYSREALNPGVTVSGPAVIEERESATVLGEGDRAIVDAIGCLIIEIAVTEKRLNDGHPADQLEQME